jgi:hypothetical protein
VNVRQILIELCSRGDDSFQTKRLSLGSGVKVCLEKWSEVTKKQIVSKNAKLGRHLAEYAVVGDEWDFQLWRYPIDKGIDPTGFAYFIGINSGQHDPTEMGPQVVKYPGSKAGYPPVTDFIGIIKSWVDIYGRIAVSSYLVDKTNVYRKILSKHFQLTPLDTDYPDIGFWIQ